jgi:hypothetical protein
MANGVRHWTLRHRRSREATTKGGASAMLRSNGGTIRTTSVEGLGLTSLLSFRLSNLGPQYPRFLPCSRRLRARTLCAINGREQVQDIASEECHYSITSSARASSMDGIARPSALAVLKLITNSNLVGCSTGRSAGFAPLSIRST